MYRCCYAQTLCIGQNRGDHFTATKDCQMSEGRECLVSEEGLSAVTEDRVNLNVFFVPSQDQTGVVKDYSKKSSPNHILGSESDQATPLENKSVINKVITFEEKTRSLAVNLQLIPKTESESLGTDVCEVKTKATKFVNISTNDLLEIKVKRQSVLKEGFHNDKLPTAARVNHTNKEPWTENKTRVVEKHGTLEMDINAQNKSLEYSKADSTDYKTQILYHGGAKMFDIGGTQAITSEGYSLEEQNEVLDLSLPKKREINKERQCEWVVDPEYEGSLHMEVDEIEDEPQHVEVEQEDNNENCWIPSNDAHTYLSQHWDGHLFSPCPYVTPTSMFTNVMTPDPMDTLLIDDQGIPYTLTPDGQKVPQIDNSQDTGELSKQEDPSPRQGEDYVQGITDDANSLCPNMSLGPVSSVEASQVVPNLESKSYYPVSPALSDLASIPIQIVANTTGSNTPILLLSPSQLQSLSSPASKSNPGLITISLPVQRSQTSSMFLVLSSAQVSSTQSSPSTGQLCQISSTSTVALPLAACPLDLGSILCAHPSLLSLGSVSSATGTDISGLNNPSNLPLSPTSSTASSSTSTVISTSPSKQSCTDAYADLPMPTSFREALLRLAMSAEKKNESHAQNIETESVATPSSHSEDSYDIKNHETETNCDDQTMSTSVDQTDSLGTISNDTSPPRPASPLFPMDNSPNQDTQGPRRILYCQYCPRVFYYLSDLERHSITHSQNKPHVCQLCGKAFKRSSHLERHKHIHTGQRNFVCQLCPRRFRESGELMRHQRVHTGEKPFQCLICHMRFAERNTLRRHMKRKHQGQQQEAMDMNAKPVGEGISLAGIQEEPEENAEWYSSTLPEMETDSDTGGE
ncbi:rho GTPase-activating protein gacF [Triplophysa rosa]|uniref:Zinc finger protein 524 n=1 Tax=Triplophysa rosa TaxID=992332 RepID=A0A9W8C428_TRIRA|nr:rho GTPase-activating protein gacF [Triplophysa rosa]XP_057196992.1 rho GTPase-activating protein gacF [Triplophysa rosa]XP_057196993.1 rho GTPase-activating protein gacF [Triplophysa rosa]XP_057196994.1 rho GTPase-activating protein gacF [Triplophysa rosa]XP_057196995.1 rho GTPase-activating protein gacF [Triplophysa rosa]KAI7806758.1 putative zinc finger protein 524 [Triplophysa rosa]